MGYSGNMYAQATEVITTQGDLRRGDSSGNPEDLRLELLILCYFQMAPQKAGLLELAILRLQCHLCLIDS